MDLVILTHAQLTQMTPELADLAPSFHSTKFSEEIDTLLKETQERAFVKNQVGRKFKVPIVPKQNSGRSIEWKDRGITLFVTHVT
ncbi:hypothetical protein TNCV_989971 [Trichonephila clavipes]|nr:hypothetical protein TNCV_989971 [Trichonephila clavipes]